MISCWLMAVIYLSIIIIHLAELDQCLTTFTFVM